jgi:tetratricopeptide (TPR) repeat protein
MTLSNERSFVMWRALSLAFRGWCLAALGEPYQGIPLITAGLAEVRANGILHVPHVLTLLADTHRMADQPQVALAFVAEAEQFAEATHTKWLQAETLRLHGDLLLILGDAAAAEARYHDAIKLAERQGARLFQLRASSNLACLWHDQGRHEEAAELSASVSKWFTQEFVAQDLIESQALQTAAGPQLADRSSTRESML